MPTIEVDTLAIAKNLSWVKQKTSVPLCIVLKADAYNHGALKIARIVEDSALCYAVATEEEALELCSSGISKKILILGELFDNDKILPENVIPSVSSSFGLNVVLRRCRSRSVQIKVNTGMNRMGCLDDELGKIINEAKKLGVKICGAFSHFYDASSPINVKKQYDRFMVATKPYESEISSLHICASNALFLDKTYHLSMVRVGLTLYGYGDEKLVPAMKIYAEVIWIGNVKRGEHVGYGDFTLEKDTRICALRLGYADGFRRNNVGACVSINGKKCRIVGKVCMDVTLVDLGDTPCKIGDRAYVLGEAISMNDFCKYFDTIPHEALVMISKRVKRIYV